MPCYRPLKAYRSSELTAKGKSKIVFKQSYPNKIIERIALPCGRCIGCKLDRSLQWAIRCTEEAQLHHQNSFITLTYSEKHLPHDGSLIPSHFVNFMKKLRKKYEPQSIRYYMCGEYGEKFTRPHYHACLFGIDFQDKEIFKIEEGICLYTSIILEQIWGRGHCTIGEVTFETAAYTARYIAKKITGKQADDHYTTTHPITGDIIRLHSEYNTMSRRPGIAKDWYDKYTTDIYPSDFLIYKGKTIKTPRYFDNLYEADDNDIETIKENRKIRAKIFAKDNTPERLAVREKIKLLNYKQLTRSMVC